MPATKRVAPARCECDISADSLSTFVTMGVCGSKEDAGDAEQKKRSQMIDRKLEEDSRRLRRECKILLLGWLSPMSRCVVTDPCRFR